MRQSKGIKDFELNEQKIRDIGNRLKEARVRYNPERKTTLKDIAELLGKSESLISKYENGGQQIDIEGLIKYHWLTGLPYDWFLGESWHASKEHEALANAGAYGLSDDALNALKNCDSDVQLLINEILRKIAKKYLKVQKGTGVDGKRCDFVCPDSVRLREEFGSYSRLLEVRRNKKEREKRPITLRDSITDRYSEILSATLDGEPTTPNSVAVNYKEALEFFATKVSEEIKKLLLENYI